MSVEACTWAWKKECLLSTTKIVLLAFAYHADKKGRCWPSVPLLAKHCRINRRNTQKHLAALVKQGLVEVRSR
ncbi:MAG: helix-turn-helix domain-containing protein [SAR202 cluster bacterium]|nr:helix-turn-helix domain-containing protein [SAR202 cluster bacterium]